MGTRPWLGCRQIGVVLIYVVLLMPTLLLVLVDRVQLRIPLVLDAPRLGHHES